MAGELKTYEIGNLAGNKGPAWIKCLVCKQTSHNPNDVENRYCGYCRRFHDQRSVAIERLMEEVRQDLPGSFYDRAHCRHNRS